MMPAHDNFYDVYSKAKKIKIKWPNNARMAIALTAEEEREEIRTCMKLFQDFVGMRPTGWLTSGMRHTERTLEILADEGFLWHGDAVNDDNPYPVNMNGKTMIIVPYKNAISR